MITITNLTRSPLAIVCSRSTQSKVVLRSNQSTSGQREIERKRISIGTAIRVRAGETSEPLSNGYKHEPEIKKLLAEGKIRINKVG